MSIEIVGHGITLTTTAGDTVYSPPADAKSCTVATGTAENVTGSIGVKLFIRVVGPTRSSWVIKGKDLSVLNSPLVLPSVTIMRGEVLQAWSDNNNAIDLALTIGEQR
jgi:hypothetical protein